MRLPPADKYVSVATQQIDFRAFGLHLLCDSALDKLTASSGHA